MNRKKRNVNNNSKMEVLDIMKFYGIILVVLGHITRMYTGRGLCYPTIGSEFLSFLTDVIYSFHMPLFVFVSGCIFAFQFEKKHAYTKVGDYKKMLWKKIIRLLVPYFFWGTLWVAPYLSFMGYQKSYFGYLFNGVFLSTDCAHLWYIFMLFNCFILFQPLNLAIERFRVPKIILLMLAFIIYCLPNNEWWAYFLQIRNTQVYFLWFVFGYCFFIYKEHFLKYGYTLLILLFFLILILYKARVSYIQIPYIECILATVGIVVFYQISLNTLIHLKYKYLYEIVNRNNFGIYLIHPIIIYAIYHEAQYWDIHPFLLTLLSFVFVMVVSIAFTV